MATIKAAKDALLDRISTLADTAATNASDTILLSDALKTLDKSVDEETKVEPAPDYHYRANRPEYGIWSSHHSHGGGMTIVDEMAVPIRSRAYWHHSYQDSADGCWNGIYSGGQKEQYASNHCWYRCNDHAPSGAECYICGTTAVGELGHYRLVTGYRALESVRQNNDGIQIKVENLNVGNAELDSKECYLRYKDTTVELRLRWLSYDHTALSSYNTSNNSQSAKGAVSFNKTRQEIAFCNRKGSTQTFTIKLYYNIASIDRDTDLSGILTAAEAGSTPAKSLDFTLNDGYNSGTAETFGNNKIVLVDDGAIMITTHEPSSFLHIAKLTRDTGDTQLTYGSHASRQIGSTTYGYDSDSAHGHMLVQSRDKKNIFLFVPFIHYQRGIISFIVSKTRSEYQQGYNWESLLHGAQVGPYGDSDFVISRNHNWDYPGEQSVICYIQKPDGTWIETDTGNQLDNSGWYTTNYPCLVPLNI